MHLKNIREFELWILSAAGKLDSNTCEEDYRNYIKWLRQYTRSDWPRAVFA